MTGLSQKNVLKTQTCPTEAGRKIHTLLTMKQNKLKTIEGSTRSKITMLWEDTVSKSYSNYLVVWGADIIFSLEIKSLLLGIAHICSEHEYFYRKMSGKSIKN